MKGMIEIVLFSLFGLSAVLIPGNHGNEDKVLQGIEAKGI
jgi:hypothetical protein